MAINAREYREELYRLRAHPSYHPGSSFLDGRDSFSSLYLSLIPFIVGEYVSESTIEIFPSGVVFPLGYLLFWAFYYTYYRPGFLEERLSMPSRWDIAGIPAILLGVAIWFVKATIVGLSKHLILRWFLPVHRTRSQSNAQTHGASFWNDPASPSNTRHHGAARPPRQPSPASRSSEPAALVLPKEIRIALTTLGLEDCRNWGEIHHRYRELAKRFHPDLNREITLVGRRFMVYDSAYRKLLAAKTRYFSERR